MPPCVSQGGQKLRPDRRVDASVLRDPVRIDVAEQAVPTHDRFTPLASESAFSRCQRTGNRRLGAKPPFARLAAPESEIGLAQGLEDRAERRVACLPQPQQMELDRVRGQPGERDELDAGNAEASG